MILDALASSAVIRYARPFSNGKRQRLTIKDLSLITKEDKQLHDFLLIVRNKHIAHPVNMQETHSVQIGYTTDELGNEYVTSVSTASAYQIPFSVEQTKQAKDLCLKWMRYLHETRQKECSDLLAIAKKLTPCEILDLPKGTFEVCINPNKIRSLHG